VLDLAFAFLVPLYLLIIFGVPLVICAQFIGASSYLFWQLGSLVAAPFVYASAFAITAGLLSRLHRTSIIPGRFPRNVSNIVYFHRRLYGLCWACVYFFPPIYFLSLTLPFLKKAVFRSFGYRGSMNFAAYPDTWIRDLPLLKMGKGAYLSNKATIGTNIALPDGTILVDSVTIGESSLVGHLAMLGPGVVLGNRVEIGVGVSVGIRTILADDVKINPCCDIEHGVQIGARTKVGSATYIGSGARIAPDLLIPAGITIPPKSRITCQQDVSIYSGHLPKGRRQVATSIV
jgi:acetyltransferase-like isoleucine patch superfamily enzyme